ncbi:NAD(P)-binding protein [Schizophyllum commune H4-8]|uniref:Ornithine cyclodeaminase n=1 Tax=Schizophyllum commune (strain H4-8 / FGSC 9210) TaxID=578458 RepID=D8Q7C1_SCHCM|nr:NAD(P)-binding protein [Schizophyllum commune H4-8]KAI5891559.1 NAD(P)-binding protein [Schizophyllum commune H4-8]
MSLLVLSAADVERATASMSPNELQILMASVFRTLSRGDRWLSSTPHRTSISMSQHTALFMPARIATDALTGTTVKVVSVPSSPGDTRGLPGSTLVLDEDTGAVKAIVNSRSLTALRNAAGSLLSSRIVGIDEPTAITTFGSGKQIEAHLHLFLRAYPSVSRCSIVNRSANERLTKLADALRTAFPHVTVETFSTSAPAQAGERVEAAVRSADIVICATSSTAPLCPSSWVQPGAHVVLIGSYKPHMKEVDSELVHRALAGALIVDSRDACAQEAGELLEAKVDMAAVHEIGELVEVDGEGNLKTTLPKLQTKEQEGGVTMFKSVGVGLQDVAIACAAVDKARAMGLGTTVEGYDS